uniref:hypothetical protein n=1 Tax=Marinobacterium profundum TaxID=1714300 RepID=UPI0008379831|nr:hypothetical protein [Marinobacterium profundum]
MQLSRCPVCHSRINLQALVQDEAGRELLALLVKLDTQAGSALVGYLSLFRAQTRDLANDRALRIALDALDLAPTAALVPALAHTVETMRSKQQQGQFKPLANHNYLKRVLEGGDNGQPIAALPAGMVTESRQGKRAAVTSSIMDIRDTDW